MSIVYSVDKLSAAEVCFAQASRFLYCEPDKDTIVSQAREHAFASVPYASDNEYVQRGLNSLETWLDEAVFQSETPMLIERVDSLRREWFRLFIGAGVPDAPCWESYYREPNSHLFGKCTLEVREYYRRWGLQIEHLHSEPDDQLGLMLGFMSRLISLEADAIAVGDKNSACDIANEQNKFLAEHILPWLAVWHYDVGKYATSSYFRGVGDFTFGLCECYANRFEVIFDTDSRIFRRMYG